MIAELTLYRCYWPTVYSYLKKFEINNFKSEAFGMLLTLDIAPEIAKRIADMLPTGAVVDMVQLESTAALDNQDIDNLLFNRQSFRDLESDKN